MQHSSLGAGDYTWRRARTQVSARAGGPTPTGGVPPEGIVMSVVGTLSVLFIDDRVVA